MRNSFVQMVVVILAVASMLVASCTQPMTGQGQNVSGRMLVLRNGNIVTLDPAKPAAQAVAIRGDRIVAVGTNEEMQRFVEASTEVIDLGGQTAIPGFIEGHGHFMNLGVSKQNLDLMDVKNWDEIVAMVAEAVKKAKPGDWIVGRGWHQEKWDKAPWPAQEGFPIHDGLSRVSPENPVFLTHASGHASYVNAKAMELCGISATTANPPGGEILKDASGRPIGVLRETATDRASRAYAGWNARKTPAQREADAREQIKLAVADALANGITSFQDAGSNFETIDMLKKARADGLLRIRLWVMVRDSNQNLRAKLPSYKAVGLGDQRLTIAAIKKSMDGALGSRGAWLLDPYSDLAERAGMNTIPVAELEEVTGIAFDNGVQLCVHAIGDRANRQVLDTYESAFKSRPSATDLRWRIEHAQHLSLADIPRFGKLGVIASMQGIHCTSDAPYVLARLGPKRAEEGAYVWRKLMNTGAIISNGTDVPVERISAIANFHATVTRKLKDGTTFYPEQRMTREEALRSMTLNAAFAAKEEKIKGSLEVGKLADITVLSKDIMKVADDEILSTKVVYTIVGGKVEFK